MDSIRAKQILQASEPVEVLFRGSPVWIENVGGNNTAEITYLESNNKAEVPVYELVENSPVEK